MRKLYVLFMFATIAACAGGGSVTPPPIAQPPANAGLAARAVITHVIVVSMENRTYDDIFGGFGGLGGAPTPYPGGNGTIPTDIAPNIEPSGFNTDAAFNAHDWYACLRVNNFSTATWLAYKTGNWPATCPTSAPPANPDAEAGAEPSALTVIDSPHRVAYTNIAQEFEIGDSYFAVQDADSFSGHQFIVALQSRNDLDEEIAGTPQYPASPPPLLDCGTSAPVSGIQTPVLNLVTGFTNWQYEGVTGECWNGMTFADRMQQTLNMTWRHYSTDSGPVFDGFVNFAAWYPFTNGTDPNTHFRIALNDLKNDLTSPTANKDFPKFAWVKPPCIPLSDHPGRSHDPYGGSDWVASIVNWVGNNPQLWPNTVIFVIWDDWGGFYDHVTPAAPGTSLDTALTPGMRQPFLVISAYDRAPGAVMHHVADYSSVLRFTENLYGIVPLNGLDSTAYTLDEYFDFSKPASKFSPISTAEPNFDPKAACGNYVGISPYEIDR